MDANGRELESQAINLLTQSRIQRSVSMSPIGFYSRVFASIRGSRVFGLIVKEQSQPRMNANERELGSKAIGSLPLFPVQRSVSMSPIGFYSRAFASIRGSRVLCS